MRTPQKIINKNTILVYMSIFYLFSFFTVVSNVGANNKCEPSYPDQMVYDGCQDVQPLLWDNSPETNVLPDSATPISISGGRAPFTWTVTGNNFYLDSAGTEQEIESESSNATIYAINACGAATVTVTDGCSSIKGVIYSTAGYWKLIQEWDPSCEDVTSFGLYPCSSYGGTISTGYTSGRFGKFWVGGRNQSPGVVTGLSATRRWNCDMKASTSNNSDVLVPIPGTGGEHKFISHVAGGLGGCYSSPGVWDSPVQIYYGVSGMVIWEWVCP